MASKKCLLLVAGLLLQPISSYIISDVFNNRYEAFIRSGDLNIGMVAQLSDQGCKISFRGLMGLLKAETLSYAVQVINEQNDILPNISLGMAVFDGCYDARTTLARMVYFLDDSQGSGWTDDIQQSTWPPSLKGYSPINFPVKGITGIMDSADAVNAAAFLGAFGVPVMSIFATSDQLSDPVRFPHFMRMVMPDRFSLNALTQIATSMNWTYVSLVYSEGEYGESGAKYLEQLLSKQSPKICIAYSNRIPSDAEEGEYLEVIEKLAKKKARVVFIWCDPNHQFGLDRALRKLGLMRNFVFFGGDGFFMRGSAIRVDHMGAKIPGFFEHMEQLRPWENKENPWIPWVWSQMFGCSWLPSSNNSCYGHPQLILTSRDFWLLEGPLYRVYQSIIVYAKAFHEMILDRCPEQFMRPNRQVLQSCVQTSRVIDYMLNVSIPGPFHQIHFDSKGDIYGQYVIKHTVGEGRDSIIVGKWDRYTGELNLNLSLLNFDALQGKDLFDPGFGDMYIPVSVCSRSCPPRHQFVRQDLECCWECYECRSNERLVGNGTLCEACPRYFWPSKEDDTQCEEIPLTYLETSNLTSIGLMVLASIGACLAVAVAVALAGLFYWRRNHRLIRATSRELSCVIILGALLTFADAFLFLLKPSNIICAVLVLGFHLTINMLFSPLTVKTLRIYRIFYLGKRSVQKPKFISTASQLVFTCIVILLQIGMVIISNGVSTVSSGLLQQVNTEPFVELRCEQALSAFLLPICFNVVLILLCAVLGYLTRKLPENFNESWYIFVSVTTTMFAWSVFLPTYFSVFYAYQQAALLSFCLLLNAFITVGCLFLPRAYAILYIDETDMQLAESTAMTSHTARIEPSTATTAQN